MDRQKGVYPYNGIFLSHKKEWNSDTCYSMDESWKHYAPWKKPGTKEQILYDSTDKRNREEVVEGILPRGGNGDLLFNDAVSLGSD